MYHIIYSKRNVSELKRARNVVSMDNKESHTSHLREHNRDVPLGTPKYRWETSLIHNTYRRCWMVGTVVTWIGTVLQTGSQWNEQKANKDGVNSKRMTGKKRRGKYEEGRNIGKYEGVESKERDCSRLNACTIPKNISIQKADHLMTGVGDIRIYSTFCSHTFH